MKDKSLPISVQKSYFMLSDAERDVLNHALGKYRPDQSEPVFVGGENQLKPALRLMRDYRLVIEEIEDGKIISSYTRWVDAVQVKGADNKEVYLTFSPRFEYIWIESKKRLLEDASQRPAHIGLRSRYAIRLYAWAKNHASVGSKRITLAQLRKVLGLEPVRDVAGNIIKEAPLPAWANLRQRALDVAIAEINKKTDLNIALMSLERSEYRRVTALNFAIKAQTKSKDSQPARTNHATRSREPVQSFAVPS